jgi:serine/threonine protein kinase
MMNGAPKIKDLGLAQVMRTSGVTGKSGTPFYEAPEVLFEEKYGQAADIWSLGIVFLELLLGQRIFKLLKGTIQPGLRGYFPSQSLLDQIKDDEMRELVKKMLMKKPNERSSSEEVLDYLNEKK